MFGTIKSKFVHNSWRIAFNGEGSTSFDIDYARNVVVFGADDSSSSHTKNRKNQFLLLGKGPTQGIKAF